MGDNKADARLRFESLHNDKGRTILLLHGIFSSPEEFSELSAPHLSGYHLLIPDLLSLTPPNAYTLPFLAEQCVALVQAEAKGGRASVVGCSLGGQLALYLAAHRPDIIDLESGGVVASGVTLFGRSSKLTQAVAPFVLWAQAAIPPSLMPMDIFGEGKAVALKSAQSKTSTYENSRNMIRSMSQLKTQPLRPRTLIVCARRHEPLKGYVADSLDDCKLLLSTIRSGDGNPESRAVGVPSCSHPWNMQKPALFASVVSAWLERRDMPSEVEPIEC